MMTCYAHNAPQRMCSWCGHEYCDANDHGHTEETCLTFLQTAYRKVQNRAIELSRLCIEAQKGWNRLKEAKE